MTEQSELLRDAIKLRAADSNQFEVVAFAEEYAERLADAGVAINFEIEAIQCRGPEGERLGLLGVAEEASDESVTLLVGKYFDRDRAVTPVEIQEILGQGVGFIELSRSGWIQANLEASSRAVEMAVHLQQRLSEWRRLRFVLITDGHLSARGRPPSPDVVAGLPASFDIWDRNRVLTAASSPAGSESSFIDLTKYIKGGLPVLAGSSADSQNGVQTYLGVLPGAVLAALFDEYGGALLESNVRTFLSARGSVNRGMQETLQWEPEMFLAYNNGLTTTAAGVEVRKTSAGLFLRGLTDWQIVNGGQTTASILHYLHSAPGRSVGEVFVQMKLVTVSSENAARVVESVARYANTQNRVTAADLFSNHDYHRRLEALSRATRAPAVGERQYRTGWYYERARGQWENDRTELRTPTRKARFEREYPRAQVLTKTDWAKHLAAWDQRPHFVSKGAQANFLDFARRAVKDWEQDESLIDETYFQIGVGKAIVFRQLASAIRRAKWFGGSYLANIAAYGISKLAFEADRQFRGKEVDFLRVWRRQDSGAVLLESALQAARAAQESLTHPKRRVANVTQWAKQESAWTRLRDVDLKLPRELAKELRRPERAPGQ